MRKKHENRMIREQGGTFLRSYERKVQKKEGKGNFYLDHDGDYRASSKSVALKSEKIQVVELNGSSDSLNGSRNAVNHPYRGAMGNQIQWPNLPDLQQHSSNHIVHISVPIRNVGQIIGKEGRHIKKLMKDHCGLRAWVQASDSRHDQHQILILEGPKSVVDKAQVKVKHFLVWLDHPNLIRAYSSQTR